MTDILERLRDQGKDAFAKYYSLGTFKLCDEAAVEIERLRADSTRMHEEAKADIEAKKALYEENCVLRGQVECARANAIEECAKAADSFTSQDLDWDTSYWNQACEQIAMRIRTLTSTERPR